MSEDASLDEFLDSESDDDGASAAEAASEDSEASPMAETAENDTATDEAVETAAARTDQQPATTTYAWDGDSAACAECGEVVERRWEQEGALVCTRCKAW